MKAKKIISVIISVMILFTSVVFSASKFPPQNSVVWTNITDKEADRLITSLSESFILVFYRDNCPNSQKSIPKILDYAAENDISVCGINANEYPRWMTWSRFGRNSVGFPYIIVHNADNGITAEQDNVFTVKQFEELLDKVGGQINNDSSGSGNAADKDNKLVFSDLSANNPNYSAIKQLVDDGVLSGYDDGTFKPNNTISRAESAVVIVRAGGLEIKSSKKSVFSDVDDSFWGKDYIMSASDAGIIKGIGDGMFAPQSQVTNIQMIKMIVCLIGLEQDALNNGGWPNGYAKVAYNNKIIDSNTYTQVAYGTDGSKPATRAQVAQWIYDARRVQAADKNADALIVNGKAYKLGMSELELGKPDEKLDSTHSFTWYVYGTDTYKNFFAAGVVDGEVIALASTGVGFEYNGYQAGQTLKSDSENNGEFLLDKNDGNIIHGVFLIDYAYKNVSAYDFTGLEDESKMNFHFVNGFRVYHKLSPCKWDDKPAKSAYLHSEDMANNNYFSHTSLDGRSMSQRMTAQGVSWTSCAENIAAGHSLGIDFYNAWVNSSGHRKNILGNYTYLGVGTAFNERSTYKFYSTQNFYSRLSAFDSFM